MNDKKQNESDVAQLEEKKRLEEQHKSQEQEKVRNQKKQALNRRREEAKEKRSLASERSKTRMGLPKKQPKETYAFNLEKAEQKEEQNTPEPRIPPSRIFEFWEKVQRRQEAMLKRAGISKTMTQISDVQMLYDKNGRETSVKVSFSGGGSIEDAGDEIKVFHSIRRKKPRFGKLHALLQAIKERGWDAVRGEIPPEMRAVVLRACKAAGIPLKTKAEMQKSNSHVAKAHSASSDFGFAGQVLDTYSKSSYVGQSAYFSSERHEHDCLIDRLFRSRNEQDKNKAQALCDNRAEEYADEMLGSSPAQEKNNQRRLYDREALVFYMRSMNVSPEQGKEFYRNLSETEKRNVLQYAKFKEDAADVVIRAQQLAVSFNRFLEGTASEGERKLFADLGSPKDLSSLTPGQVNNLMQAFGKKGLPFDDIFRTENGFSATVLSLGEKADRTADILLSKTTKTQFDSVAEFSGYFATNLRDLPARAAEHQKSQKAKKQEQEKRRQEEKNKQLSKKAPDFVRPADKLPKDKKVLGSVEGMAAYIGIDEKEIAGLSGLPANNPKKALIEQGRQFYNVIKKDRSLTPEMLKEKLDAFLTASPAERKEIIKEEQRLREERKAQREVSSQDRAPLVQFMEQMQSEIGKMADGDKSGKVSTMDMLAKLKKMQKKETAKKKPVKKKKKQQPVKNEVRGAQLQAYLLKQRAGR